MVYYIEQGNYLNESDSDLSEEDSDEALVEKKGNAKKINELKYNIRKKVIKLANRKVMKLPYNFPTLYSFYKASKNEYTNVSDLLQKTTQTNFYNSMKNSFATPTLKILSCPNASKRSNSKIEKNIKSVLHSENTKKRRHRIQHRFITNSSNSKYSFDDLKNTTSFHEKKSSNNNMVFMMNENLISNSTFVSTFLDNYKKRSDAILEFRNYNPKKVIELKYIHSKSTSPVSDFDYKNKTYYLHNRVRNVSMGPYTDTQKIDNSIKDKSKSSMIKFIQPYMSPY